MIVLLFAYTWGFRLNEWMGLNIVLSWEQKKSIIHPFRRSSNESQKRNQAKERKKGNSSINCFSFDQKRVTHSGEKGPVTNADKKSWWSRLMAILSYYLSGKYCLCWQKAIDVFIERPIYAGSSILNHIDFIFVFFSIFFCHASSLCHFSTLLLLLSEFSSFSSLSNNFPF